MNSGLRVVKLVSKVLLGVFFILAGVNHFISPDFYTNIMPDYMPLHTELVYLSGVTEVVAGIMLLVPATSRWGAWFIIAHLIAFMPVHIHMIVHAGRYADMASVPALYFRIVVQAILVLWAYWHTRPVPSETPPPPPEPAASET